MNPMIVALAQRAAWILSSAAQKDNALPPPAVLLELRDARGNLFTSDLLARAGDALSVYVQLLHFTDNQDLRQKADELRLLVQCAKDATDAWTEYCAALGAGMEGLTYNWWATLTNRFDQINSAME